MHNLLLIKRCERFKKNLPRQDIYQAVVPVADESSKLSKLKEQGILTEGEFLHMKNNLTKGSKD
jgi:hypothetical protein